MSDVTVYEKRTCTTCRKVARAAGGARDRLRHVEYHVEGLTEPQIRELLAKAGIPARAALRMREEGAAELAARRRRGRDRRGDGARPELLQRPIVVNGDRAVLARPPEKVLELFQG